MATGKLADQGEKLVKNAKEAIKEELIVLWEHLPQWQRDNQYIVRGYRKATNSYRKSFASLGYIHNETVNIYTHLLGSLAFACLAPSFYNLIKSGYSAQASTEDIYVFACFFVGAVFCLGMSATYHTISNHSEAVHKFGNKLDYFGIILLIWGSFVPCIYYGFGCHPEWMNTYWTMITTMAAACGIVTCFSTFATPEWRPFRACMFVALGLSAVLPVAHAMQLHSLSKLDELMGLRWVVLEGVLYISGAAIYARRIPERYEPGRWDILGASHQIFHVLVVMAAFSHLNAIVIAFNNRAIYHVNGMDLCSAD